MSRAVRKQSSQIVLRSLEALVLGGFVLYAAKPVLVPIVLAILLSFVLSPIVRALQQLGLRRVPAVLVTVCLSFFAMGLVAWATAIEVQNLAAELPRHKEEIRA